jgi:hypothetical protein
MFGMLALAGAGLYSKWRGAHEATKGLDKNLEKVAEFMEPYKTKLDEYNTLSQDYMDSTSGLNQNLLNQYQQSGMDFAASQNRMSSRNLSSGGLGGFSGLQHALSQSNYMKAQNQAMETWRQNLLNNRQTGISLMDKYLDGQKGYGETMAQGWLQNDQLKRQMEQAKWSGLGSGLLSIAGGM